MARGPYAKRTDRYINLSTEQKALQLVRQRRWKSKNPELCLLGNIRCRARKEGLPFNLTIEDINIPEYCPVFGTKLIKGVGKPTANSPSVDRIIPALGYTKGNIIIVSYLANVIKTNATYDQILKVGMFYRDLIEGQLKAA